MTGLSSSAVKEKAIRHDAMLYFEKPSTLDEFLQLGSMIRGVFEQGMAKSGHQTTQGGAV